MFDCRANSIFIITAVSNAIYVLETMQYTYQCEVDRHEKMAKDNANLSAQDKSDYIDACTSLYITNAILEYLRKLYAELAGKGGTNDNN